MSVIADVACKLLVMTTAQMIKNFITESSAMF